jgi:hypothetical protein
LLLNSIIFIAWRIASRVPHDASRHPHVQRYVWLFILVCGKQSKNPSYASCCSAGAIFGHQVYQQFSGAGTVRYNFAFAAYLLTGTLAVVLGHMLSTPLSEL